MGQTVHHLHCVIDTFVLSEWARVCGNCALVLHCCFYKLPSTDVYRKACIAAQFHCQSIDNTILSKLQVSHRYSVSLALVLWCALTLHPCAPWIVGFSILEWDSSDFVALVHFKKLEHENNLDITKTRILYFTRCFAWFIRITIN